MTVSDDPVLAFVHSAKALPIEDASIIALLRQAGWGERRAYAAIAAYYEGQLGARVPQRGSRARSAREAFLYIISFITLGVWACALGHFLFAIIDHQFPDLNRPLDHVESLREAVSWDVASIIVAFPIYLLSMWKIADVIGRRPEAVESKARITLTYAALVIATIIVVSDLVFFLATLLRGGLTLPFGLKSAVAILIAGATFWYYVGTVQHEAP